MIENDHPAFARLVSVMASMQEPELLMTKTERDIIRAAYEMENLTNTGGVNLNTYLTLIKTVLADKRAKKGKGKK
jgi:hypothetical protein